MSIRKAFSLTELLIVLVILGVLFTAALPVVTKRQVTNYLNDSVWNYVYADEQKDAYYHPDIDNKHAVAFIGTTGDRDWHGKLSIRANIHAKVGGLASNPDVVQRHIQFRYGKDTGMLAGTLFADEYSMLLGASYNKLLSPNYITNYDKNAQSSGVTDEQRFYNKYNTIMGINTGDNLDYLGRSVLIGNNSIGKINQDAISDDEKEIALKGIIAIGNDVYSKSTKIAPNNIFIGNNTGGIDYGYEKECPEPSESDPDQIKDQKKYCNYNWNNTVIGYNALPYREEGWFSNYTSDPYKRENTLYQNNVFLGANTGGYYRPLYSNSDKNMVVRLWTYNKLSDDVKHKADISRNVIIGSEFESDDASDNIIIGHGAYENGSSDIKYLTAIGNGACNSVESINQTYPNDATNPYRRYIGTAKFPRTCIGVNSAKEVNEAGVLYWVDKTTNVGNQSQSLNIIGRNYRLWKPTYKADGTPDYYYSNSNYQDKGFFGAYPQGDERIYIGTINRDLTGKDYTAEGVEHGYKGGFAGRSPLEIHNVPEPGKYKDTYGKDWRTGFASDASVILNTNLVVRGLFMQDLTAPYNEDITYSDSFAVNTIATPYAKLMQPPIYYTLPYDDSRESVDTERNCIFYTNSDDKFSKYQCGISLKTLKYSASANTILYSNNKSAIESVSALERSGPYDSFRRDDMPNISSDRRLKTDLTENNDGLEKLLQLKPYHYTFKSDILGAPQVGVIAQDLQKIFPNAVSSDKDGFLKIRWDEMFYAMINSIKALGAKLEKIATSISDLEVSTITIKNQHKDLRKEVAQLNARAARLERK